MQQVPKLTTAGYTVILPLLPGHGATYSWKPQYSGRLWWKRISGYIGDDCKLWHEVHPSAAYTLTTSHHTDIDDLPTSLSEFSTFVDRVNAVMRLAPGKRIVSGLSLGGGYATLIGSTLVTDTNQPLYDRQYVFTQTKYKI